MRDYHEGGGVWSIKYYRSAENRWGIVFTARRVVAVYKG